MKIKVLVNGANGKMGKITVATLEQEEDFALVGKTGSQDDLKATILKTDPDIVIDFTTPHVVMANVQTIIEQGVRPVVGTTGLTAEQIQTLSQQCAAKGLGCIIGPNFSLGAVLMMKYAADAARYLHDIEIIEMHHPHKLDAPSGTAVKTAQLMASQRQGIENINKDHSAARGNVYQGIPIHSVRLPGVLASQTVILGGAGETLSIRYDSIDRQCHLPGVLLACRKVMTLDHLVYGLENLIDPQH